MRRRIGILIIALRIAWPFIRCVEVKHFADYVCQSRVFRCWQPSNVITTERQLGILKFSDYVQFHTICGLQAANDSICRVFVQSLPDISSCPHIIYCADQRAVIVTVNRSLRVLSD